MCKALLVVFLLLASSLPAATVRGRITQCFDTVNAPGYVVRAFEEVTFGFLFLGSSPPQCMDAADSNGDGVVDISDGVNTLSFLFAGGKTIPAPGPGACGFGPRELPNCSSYDRC